LRPPLGDVRSRIDPARGRCTLGGPGPGPGWYDGGSQLSGSGPPGPAAPSRLNGSCGWRRLGADPPPQAAWRCGGWNGARGGRREGGGQGPPRGRGRMGQGGGGRQCGSGGRGCAGWPGPGPGPILAAPFRQLSGSGPPGPHTEAGRVRVRPGREKMVRPAGMHGAKARGPGSARLGPGQPRPEGAAGARVRPGRTQDWPAGRAGVEFAGTR
jgi:hypothetical protein